MRLDPVHDVQRAYRSLVTATSFPGTVVDLSEQAGRIDLDSPLPRPLLLLAIMLLDAEVTFAVGSGQSDSDAATISQLTYARRVPADEAAFILVTRGGRARAAGLMRGARRGTLVNPHLGATVLVEVQALEAGSEPNVAGSSEVDTEGRPRSEPALLSLAGPGIPNEQPLAVTAPEIGAILTARAEANHEYPLGVELILYTGRGLLVSIPRTTQITIREAAWAT